MKARHEFSQAKSRRSQGRSGLLASASDGFTLIELTVSLTAGLFVALAVFGLSKAATATFNDEARSAGAELSLRIATNRIQADLQRVANMSTGNILVDPLVVPNLTTGSPVGLRGLSGMRLTPGGSAPAMVVGSTDYSALNQMSPDVLELAGNYTTTDEYDVAAVTANGGCTRVSLTVDSPAMWRISAVGAAAQAEALRMVFQPVPATQADGTPNPAANSQFLARLYDPITRCTQYFATCNNKPAAGFSGPTPFVDLDGTPVYADDGVNRCGLRGFGIGYVLNPIQWVRWEVNNVNAVAAQSMGGPATTYAALQESLDPTKFDLLRTFENANLQPVGVPEVIAEYAVDFKVALTVDTELNSGGAGPSLLTFPLDTSTGVSNDSGQWAYFLDKTPPIGFKGPQRIRGAQVRLVTRAALPDRGTNVTAPAGYAYRYCVQPGASSLATCNQFARVRTVAVQAALPNQARMFY